MRDRFEDKLFRMAKQEKIKTPEALNDKIDSLLSDLPEKKKIYKMNVRRSLILAAALVMLFSITATASVGIMRERMEAMNREKLEEFFNQIYMSKVPHDNYNRYFTSEERERMKILQSDYEEKGLFPKGELTLIDEPKEYKGKGISYLADTGTFFLPEKEMSDEHLLQIIDFRHKRDYSLQKMNEMIASGEVELSDVLEDKPEVEETDSAILESDAVWDPSQKLVINYDGDVTIDAMGAGKNDIYLGGWNTVQKMAIGTNTSEVFYDDFEKETRVSCIYVDNAENVYFIGAELEKDKKKDGDDYEFPDRTMILWKVDKNGKLLQKLRLADYSEDTVYWSSRMAVDNQGNIYLRGIGNYNNQIAVIDADGKLVSMVDSGEYHFHTLGGIGLGADGKMYTTVLTEGREMGIASINIKEGKLDEIYMGIVPDDTILIDLIAPGADSDFVLWGYDGIFNYNLGDESAINVLPAYEAPCDYEGVCFCALADGRVVFASCTEHVEETYGAGEYRRFRAAPGKTTFYYEPSLRKE